MTKEGELVCDFPASASGIEGGRDIVQNCIRLREKVAQGLMVKLGSSDSKNALSVATHSAQGVQPDRTAMSILSPFRFQLPRNGTKNNGTPKS